MWHKYYDLQIYPILLLHTYIVRCFVIMKAYHPLTDIPDSLLCSGLLKTYQCTYHTYWILLEIWFISHIEQVWQYSLEIEMTHDCCILYLMPCTLFLWNTQPPKVNFHSKQSYTPEQVGKVCESLWSYMSSRGGSCLEYSYLKSE